LLSSIQQAGDFRLGAHHAKEAASILGVTLSDWLQAGQQAAAMPPSLHPLEIVNPLIGMWNPSGTAIAH